MQEGWRGARLLKHSLLLLAAARLVVADVPASEPPALQLGRRQVQEGLLNDAVVTLDAVILELTPQAATRKAELIDALVYKGWALVGLVQEEGAKASFREALRWDPTRRLTPDRFPDRVIRVFEAARTGKAKSVMERPAGTPKKAGIGALGVAAIAGGVVLVVGGAAVVVSGDDCQVFPSGFIPFSQVYYTAATTGGDTLVVGRLDANLSRVQALPLPSGGIETFCGSVTLGPGVTAQAYIPTASERNGDFSAYLPGTILRDPATNAPFPGNILPLGSLSRVFAWRTRP